MSAACSPRPTAAAPPLSVMAAPASHLDRQFFTRSPRSLVERSVFPHVGAPHATAARRHLRSRHQEPRNGLLYGRVMNANLASIMPQVIGVWCEEAGHDVTLVCYTGVRGPARRAAARPRRRSSSARSRRRPSSPTRSSNLFRSRGAVTVLGGPHARCYPEDARQVLRLRARLHRPRPWCATCCGTAARTGR